MLQMNESPVKIQPRIYIVYILYINPWSN